MQSTSRQILSRFLHAVTVTAASRHIGIGNDPSDFDEIWYTEAEGNYNNMTRTSII